MSASAPKLGVRAQHAAPAGTSQRAPTMGTPQFAVGSLPQGCPTACGGFARARVRVPRRPSGILAPTGAIGHVTTCPYNGCPTACGGFPRVGAQHAAPAGTSQRAPTMDIPPARMGLFGTPYLAVGYPTTSKHGAPSPVMGLKTVRGVRPRAPRTNDLHRQPEPGSRAYRDNRESDQLHHNANEGEVGDSMEERPLFPVTRSRFRLRGVSDESFKLCRENLLSCPLPASVRRVCQRRRPFPRKRRPWTIFERHSETAQAVHPSIEAQVEVRSFFDILYFVAHCTICRRVIIPCLHFGYRSVSPCVVRLPAFANDAGILPWLFGVLSGNILSYAALRRSL